MKRPVPVESAFALIDEKIKELGDWRGKTLAKVREIIHEADPDIVEEWKWMGTPIWSHGGIVCTGETYKNVVKMTFPKGPRVKLDFLRGVSSSRCWPRSASAPPPIFRIGAQLVHFFARPGSYPRRLREVQRHRRRGGRDLYPRAGKS